MRRKHDAERAAVVAAAFISAVQIAYERWIADGAEVDPSPVLQRCIGALQGL